MKDHGIVGLTFGLLIVLVERSSGLPTSIRATRGHNHEGFWSNNGFIDTLSDYLASAENLKKSNDFTRAVDLSPLSSEIVTQVASSQSPSKGYYNNYNSPLTSPRLWEDYAYPGSQRAQRSPRVLRYQDVQESESQNSYSRVKASSQSASEKKPHEVLVFHLPPEFKKPQSIILNKVEASQRSQRRQEQERLATRTTQASIVKEADDADEDFNDEDEYGDDGDQRPQQSISSHSHYKNAVGPSSAQPTLSPAEGQEEEDEVRGQSPPVISHPMPYPHQLPHPQQQQPRPQQLAHPQQQLAHPQQQQQPQYRNVRPPPSQLGSPSLIIATTAPMEEMPPMPLLKGGSEYLENEVESKGPEGLMGTLGTWMETGRKVLYFPRGVVDVIDKAMTYAEGNPTVGFMMDTVADKLFGSTKQFPVLEQEEQIQEPPLQQQQSKK